MVYIAKYRNVVQRPAIVLLFPVVVEATGRVRIRFRRTNGGFRMLMRLFDAMRLIRRRRHAPEAGHLAVSLGSLLLDATAFERRRRWRRHHHPGAGRCNRRFFRRLRIESNGDKTN